MILRNENRLWLAGLLTITLLGGVFRFAMLGQPPIWGDEANTYSRVAGSYDTLLNLLQDAGFAPLHYEAEWLVGRVAKLTPPALRFFPALCGTLMIPGIYFLARQMVHRKAALLAAGFVACSGFACFYSRDAKMYAPFYLFITLTVASLLWWLRAGHRVAWWAWVAAGTAMVGTHGLGMIIMGLQPLILMTSRKLKWAQSAWFTLGLLVIFAGPAGYYLMFNDFVESASDGLRGSGIGWVNMRNADQTGMDLIKDSTAAYLMAWNWIQEFPHGEVPPKVIKAAEFCFAMICGLLALGMLPWGKWSARRGSEDRAGTEWWRAALWLSVWIVIPYYVFYCASVEESQGPGDWMSGLMIVAGSIAFGAIAIVCAVFGDGWVRTRGVKSLQLIGVVMAMLLMCAVVHAALPERGDTSIFLPRYLGLTFPAIAVAIGALLMRLPTLPFRWGAIAIVLGINTVQSFARLVADSEPPMDRVSADVWASQGDDAKVRAYTPNPLPRAMGNPGTATITSNAGLYYMYIARGGNDPPEHRMRVFLDHSPFEMWQDADPGEIKRDVDRHTRLNRVIVWENPDDTGSEDEVLNALGKDWKKVSEEHFKARVYWTWAKMFEYRRREYVKQGAAR